MAKKKTSKKKPPPRVDKPKAKAGGKKKAAKKSAKKKAAAKRKPAPKGMAITKSARRGGCAAASIRHTHAETPSQTRAAMRACDATDADLSEFGKVGGKESQAARKGEPRVYMGREVK